MLVCKEYAHAGRKSRTSDKTEHIKKIYIITVLFQAIKHIIMYTIFVCLILDNTFKERCDEK